MIIQNKITFHIILRKVNFSQSTSMRILKKFMFDKNQLKKKKSIISLKCIYNLSIDFFKVKLALYKTSETVKI